MGNYRIWLILLSEYLKYVLTCTGWACFVVKVVLIIEAIVDD